VNATPKHETTEDVVQAARFALAEKFTSAFGDRNPDWDIDKDDDPVTNPYLLTDPMEHRALGSLMVTFRDSDGHMSFRAATIPEVVDVIASANLLASTAPPAPQPEKVEWALRKDKQINMMYVDEESRARELARRSGYRSWTLVSRSVGPWTAVTE
jgi:hypothetical protein